MSEDDRQPSTLPHPALALGYKPPKKFKNTVDRIENALRVVADVIAHHGEEYLPIFERLEKELEIHKARDGALSRALDLASKSVGKT